MMNPQATARDVQHLLGPINDHLTREILDLSPSLGELEVAAAYCAGLTDVMGEERAPLTGTAARVYELVSRDEALLEEEERRA